MLCARLNFNGSKGLSIGLETGLNAEPRAPIAVKGGRARGTAAILRHPAILAPNSVTVRKKVSPRDRKSPNRGVRAERNGFWTSARGAGEWGGPQEGAR